MRTINEHFAIYFPGEFLGVIVWLFDSPEVTDSVGCPDNALEPSVIGHLRGLGITVEYRTELNTRLYVAPHNWDVAIQALADLGLFSPAQAKEALYWANTEYLRLQTGGG